MPAVPSLADDRDAIRDLYARYVLSLDTGDAATFASLYAEDGVFVGGGTGGDDVVGREALLEFAAGLAVGSTHRLSLNHVIDVDGDTAGCRSSIVVLAGTAVVSAGRVHDEFRRVDGAWRIARRTFTPDPS
ncbi:nuclear transport factor 2 family protein [Blastococcus sp. URHD0036]|uniref:nuclear transport factor 2 family protein n=1 Tax=Blastococcus sp. URHD0036 TaxID=1380356 RepID=UPI0006916A68|nr:nuclear transport factor 2 family protein [Blastococcus sp. URHD0036]